MEILSRNIGGYMEYSTLIMGSMYSGKSEELKRLIKRSEIAGKKCQVFKLDIDDRYSDDQILTHDAAKMIKDLNDPDIKKVIAKLLGSEAISVKDPQELLNLVDDDTKVVGIDEIQLFPESILDVIETLNKRNIRVIMSGLDMYASGDVFPIVAQLACKCKYVEKAHAVCVDCGADAAYSYRIDSNEGNSKATIEIGSAGKYIAVCEKCKEKRERKK
jgi:thymidine kinase